MREEDLRQLAESIDAVVDYAQGLREIAERLREMARDREAIDFLVQERTPDYLH